MRPPVAEKTSLPGGMANEGKVWFRARLGKQGKLSDIMVLPGVGATPPAGLAAEIDSWQFRPAIRNGSAVEVDVVIEGELKRRN
jgi:hypothetical protein